MYVSGDCISKIGETKQLAKTDRWEKLIQTMSRLNKIKSHKELLCRLVVEISNLIRCNKLSIFVVDPEIAEAICNKQPSNLHVQKLFHLRRWYTILSSTYTTMCAPQFDSLKILKAGRKTY